LLGRAKADKKTIVLPESDDERVLRAAHFLLSHDIANLILLGEKEKVLAHAAGLELNLDDAQFESIETSEHLPAMIEELVKLRAHKGMTQEKAVETLKDPSYFGTMLIQLGFADGMVSGAIHSTANTVRPALQIIKTKPGESIVSGAFIMCLDTRVDIYADCAITLNPTPAQSAEIAIQSANTARTFGLDPVIGFLSYSTLGSGSGPDVDLVEEAVRLAQEKDPDQTMVGPIQFDAAWSPEVAKIKAQGNPAAGHVNTFIFPDLSAGNIAYKAVQRSSKALAIGPGLQGLRKPVNDLSRGASIQDIINTVALTAIEAQNE
jgi:phosphate acetyltransferase